ncbi:Periplasmic murein peptide-binding protein [Halomonadaceae bacterium LMG 33818]|uniref:peptide ABC transporter substrate-binding protein n=1 Tax=Cernens ardua TaxID=3402176 RepID=UPI003EDBD7FF
MKPTLIKASLITAALALPSVTLAATLNIGIIGDPASLSPAKITGGVWEEDILQDLFTGLVSVSADGKLIPGVASHWDISDGGKTYTFHLRPSKWSDGTPVTAHDFVYGMRYFVTPKNAATGVERLYPIVNAQKIATGKAKPDTLGVSAPNNDTLVIHLNEPAPYFIKMLVLPPFYPMPAHVVDKYGDQWSNVSHIVVNGAFKPTKWITGTELDTVKNPDFYDAKEVSLDGVDYYPAPGDGGVTRFRAGELDVLRDFPASRYDFLKQATPNAVKITPSLGTYYYTFNMRKGQPTADIRVREALSLAIRRNVIADHLLDGAVKPAYSLVPPGTSDYTVQPQPGLQDNDQQRLATAKKLLQEAGYGPNQPLNLTVSYNSGAENAEIAVAIGAMWRPLGVNVTMNNTDPNVHYGNLRRGKFQVGRAAWISSYDDAQNFLQLVYSVGNNYGDYQDPTFRHLFAESNVEQNPQKRRDLLQQAEKRFSSQFVLAPIYTYTARNLVSPELKGWDNNALDIHPSRWVSKGN